MGTPYEQDINFWHLLKNRQLFPLLRLRWTGQATDGLFQSALASFVLFSPERQANAMAAATAFAVVLLPYSIVGPFVGTVLDRTSRQRAIAIANALRALVLIAIATLVVQGLSGIPLTLLVLVAFGLNRLILAALSAGLPLLAPAHGLIASNALAVTGGSVWVVMGGGIGLGIRKISDTTWAPDNADGILLITAAAGYLLASFFAWRMSHSALGPRAHEVKKESLGAGLQEIREGFTFLRVHPDAARGIVATAVHRGGITAMTLVAIVLERNTFHDPAESDAGLAGLSIALSIAAIGFTIGALIAPIAVRSMGRHRWMRLSMVMAALGALILVFHRSQTLLCASAFVIALFGQSVKVTSDALVQSKINDEFRGRVFAVYDVVVNASIVGSSLFAASILPASGDSYLVPLLVAFAYFVVGLVLLRPSKFYLKNEPSTTA